MLHPRPVRRHLAGPPDFEAGSPASGSSPPGAAASTSGSRSTTGDALLGHLGMSGQLLVQPRDAGRGAPSARRASSSTTATTSGSSTSGCSADCSCPRAVPSCPPRSRTSPATRSTRSSTTPRFSAPLCGASTGIKRALLDQTLISGVGNIYADEALWAARLHYARPTETLRRREVARLLAEVRAVMARALAEGGTSFDALYVNVNGESGYFERSLAVYGQEGRAVPALRSADPPRRVHEPLVVHVPALPAPAASCPLVKAS